MLAASDAGHDAVVSVLLARRDVDANKAASICGLAPLASAAIGGYDLVIEQLLSRSEVDANKAYPYAVAIDKVDELHVDK